MKTKWEPITEELKKLAGWQLLVATQLSIMFLGFGFMSIKLIAKLDKILENQQIFLDLVNK